MFLGGDQEKEKTMKDSFCEVCRAAKKNLDCSRCSREVKILDLDTVRKEKHG
jgi:hypothetical protein